MPYFIQYAKNGLLEPLNSDIEKSKLDMNNIVASSVKAYQYKGQQLAIPRDVDSIAVWYNKKLFDEAKVSYPTNDWTWDQLKAKATQLKAGLKGDEFPLVMDLSNDGQDSYLTCSIKAAITSCRPTANPPTSPTTSQSGSTSSCRK